MTYKGYVVSDTQETPSWQQRRRGSLGKSAFVKEVLFDNPKANAKVVNEAWLAAGMQGTISESLVKVLRSELGLAGNLRTGSTLSTTKAATKAPKAKPAAKPKKKAKTTTKKAQATMTPARMNATGLPRPTDRDRVLADIETEIDNLIFKLMAIGGLEKVEESLRMVRRDVVRCHKS